MKFFRNILFLSLILIIILPLYNSFIAYPKFFNTLLKETEKDAEVLTKHLTSMLQLPDGEFSRDDLATQGSIIKKHIEDYHLYNVKIFLPSGEVVYSKFPEEIGEINKKTYFHKIVGKGEIYKQYSSKNTKSLDGRIITADVVETYIPVMRDNEFYGALEIYYDITAMKGAFEKQVMEYSLIGGGIGLIFFSFIIMASLKAKKSISQLIDTEKALNVSEENYRSIFDNVNDAIFIHNIENGDILNVNKKMTEMFGYTRGEALCLKVQDISLGKTPYSQKEALQWLKETAKGEPQYFEWMCKDKFGRLFWTEVNLKPITLEGSKRVVAVVRDIDTRKRSEELLLQSKQDWEDSFNTITDMITIHDKDYNIIRANKAAEKLLKLPKLEEILNVKCFKYYHGTDGPPEGCPSCDCYKTGKPATFEIFEPNLNMFIEIRAIARLDDNNQIVGLIHVVRDITERKKIQDVIQRTKVEWETIFDNVSELIVLVNEEGKILRCNKSFSDFVNKSFNELIGIQCTNLIPVSPQQLKPEAPATKIEVQMLGNGKWLFLSCCPIIDENDKFLRTVIVGSDITSLKKTEERLVKSEDELKTRVNELEKFYEIAVGRELRMKQLKTEIKKLKKENTVTNNIV
jgi:PAS domain S-box-containing protein